MSHRGRNRGFRPRNQTQSSSAASREPPISLPENSPVLAMFKDVARRLTFRQDRYERLVKLSRDITIESKRIIFLLHSAIGADATTKAVHEAKERLQKLVQGPIKAIGLELDDQPAHLHSRAYTAGLQEFIEARTLCSLMDKRELVSWKEVQEEFQYKLKLSSSGDEVTAITTMIPWTDYMLGVADLTGELMRRTINSITSGENDECFFCCQVVKQLYTGFLGLYGIDKELARKMGTSRANVGKVEAAAYALRVRGDSAPPALLAPRPDWDGHESDDEGFY